MKYFYSPQTAAPSCPMQELDGAEELEVQASELRGRSKPANLGKFMPWVQERDGPSLFMEEDGACHCVAAKTPGLAPVPFN